MGSKGSQNIKVLPITDSRYEKVIRVYWTWILDNYQGLNHFIRKVNDDRIYLTRACYLYTDVSGINDETGRRNLCGSVPQTNHVQAVSIGKAASSEYDYIFLPVIDTLVYKQARGSSGQTLSQEEINAILVYENDAVTPSDITVTVQEKVGQGWSPAVPLVPNILNYRTSSPLDPNDTFQLNIPQNSSLADKMEFHLTPGSSLDARAQGYYLLIEKPSGKGTYQFFSKGLGLRNYRSFISVTIEA